MPLTLSQTETAVLRSIGGVMTAVGLDGTTVNGTNPDLVEPIRGGLLAMGLDVDSSSGATDAEVAEVPNDSIPQFYCLVEYYALEAAWGASLLMVDQSLGSESQSLSQVRAGIEARLAWLKERVGTLIPSAATPGPSSSGLIRAGRCYPRYPNAYWSGWRAWRGGFCQPPWP